MIDTKQSIIKHQEELYREYVSTPGTAINEGLVSDEERFEVYARRYNFSDINEFKQRALEAAANIPEEELMEKFGEDVVTEDNLLEFLQFVPLAGEIAAAGVARAAGSAVGSTVAKNIATKTGSNVAGKVAGNMAGEKAKEIADDKLAKVVDRLKSNATSTQTAATQAKQILQQNPDIKKAADEVGLSDDEFTDVISQMVTNKEKLGESTQQLTDKTMLDLYKDVIKKSKNTKSLEAKNVFANNLGKGNPKSISKQMVEIYGDPMLWTIESNDDGVAFIMSGLIPENDQADKLAKEIEKLGKEATKLRNEYEDVDADYMLPQEHKIEELLKEESRLRKGSCHQIVGWITDTEARAILRLTRDWYA